MWVRVRESTGVVTSIPQQKLRGVRTSYWHWFDAAGFITASLSRYCLSEWKRFYQVIQHVKSASKLSPHIFRTNKQINKDVSHIENAYMHLIWVLLSSISQSKCEKRRAFHGFEHLFLSWVNQSIWLNTKFFCAGFRIGNVIHFPNGRWKLFCEFDLPMGREWIPRDFFGFQVLLERMTHNKRYLATEFVHFFQKPTQFNELGIRIRWLSMTNERSNNLARCMIFPIQHSLWEKWLNNKRFRMTTTTMTVMATATIEPYTFWKADPKKE